MQPGHALCFVYSSLSLARAVQAGVPLPASQPAALLNGGKRAASTSTAPLLVDVPMSARELEGRGLVVALRPLHRLPGTARTIAALTLHSSLEASTKDEDDDNDKADDDEKDGLCMLCLSLPRSQLFALPVFTADNDDDTDDSDAADASTWERGAERHAHSSLQQSDALALLPADLLHALAPVAQAPESKRESTLDTAAAAAAVDGSKRVHGGGGTEAVVVPCCAVVMAFRIERPSLLGQRSPSVDALPLEDDTSPSPLSPLPLRRCDEEERSREVNVLLMSPVARIVLPPQLLASCPTFAAPSAGAEFGAPALAPQSLEAYLQLMAALRTSCRRDKLVRAPRHPPVLFFKIQLLFSFRLCFASFGAIERLVVSCSCVLLVFLSCRTDSLATLINSSSFARLEEIGCQVYHSTFVCLNKTRGWF